MSSLVRGPGRAAALRAVLSLALVTFTLSESLFRGQWSEAYGRSPLDLAAAYLAHVVVVLVVLVLLERTDAGVRGLVLTGALLGSLVTSAAVRVMYEAQPWSGAVTALAWHALVTLVVGWWGIRVVAARSPRTAFLAAVTAGAAWGMWCASRAQVQSQGLPADNPDAFAGYVLVTLVLLVGGALAWQSHRPAGSAGAPAARLVGSAGLAGLAVIATYTAAQAWGGQSTAVWDYPAHVAMACAGLLACVQLIRSRTSGAGSGRLAALDRLGDLLDAPEPGVPGRTDLGQLGDGAGELCLVDLEPLLPAGRGGVNQAYPVEDDQVLRHGLASHRQLLAETRGRAAALVEQQVDHPPPGGVSERRPQVVVDHDAHASAPTFAA